MVPLFEQLVSISITRNNRATKQRAVNETSVTGDT